MRLMKLGRARSESGGQAMVEFALVFPIFTLVLFSIIVLGLYVFYNQQLQGATGEAARYAAVHSSTAQCPTVGQINPILSNQPADSYNRCDAPEESPPWPDMTAAARSKVWGMNPGAVSLVACWSGFVDPNALPAANADTLPSAPGAEFRDCTITVSGVPVNPQADPGSIPCPPPLTTPSAYGRDGELAGGGGQPRADGDDKASDLAYANGVHYPTRVTVYACFNWSPPMSGFVFIPSQITLRAVVTEVLQRQQ